MKRILALAAAILVPALIFLNTLQGYAYHAISGEVTALETQQRVLLEKNMGVVSRIAYEQSPLRIEQKAEEQLHLVAIDQSRVTRVIMGGAGGRTQ
jgi:hypothetical protein